jgi:Flp pilus assembly protein TadG
MPLLLRGWKLTDFKRFLRDTSGQFAIMAAVVSVPLLMGVGLAVDYSNILRLKTELQTAVDSAVLAVAHEADKIDDTKAFEIADKFLRANLSESFSNLSVVRSGRTVNISANLVAPVHFGGLFGFPSVDLNAKASTEIVYVNYEIALALDTTGSMAGGKLQAMKEAVSGLIDTMAAQNTRTDSLKFALVPFSSKVNVGAQFGPEYNADGTVKRAPAAWLDSLAKSPISQSDLDPGVSRFALMRNMGVTWEGCVEARASTASDPYDVNDEEPNASDPETMFVPAFASDEPDTGSFPNSYLGDGIAAVTKGTAAERMQRYGAVYNAAFKSLTFAKQIEESLAWTKVTPNLSNQTFFGGYPVPKGPNFGCDVQPIVPLSTNFPAIKAKVDALQALGSTNIIEGAAWGWRVLSSRAPFTEGQRENVSVRKILVVLTDGTNNLGQISNTLGSMHSSYGYLADGRLGIESGTAEQVSEAMNEKTLQACTNAKKDGVEIYTIRLEEPNVATGNMLKDCATDADHYIDVPNRSLLDEAFEKIADKISIIRLSS